MADNTLTFAGGDTAGPAATTTTTGGFDWGGAAGTATQLIGGLAGAFTADQISKNNEAYELYQAEIAKINYEIKLDQQKDILIQGQIQLAEHSRQVGDAIADNINAQGGGGFQISDDAITSISRMGDRQADEIRKSVNNSYLQVGYEALGLKYTATQHELAAQNERDSGRTTALTKGASAISGAANSFNKLGAFKGRGTN